MQAPHHGSSRLDVRPLLQWAAPRLVVSGQGPPRGAGGGTYYDEGRVPLWTTHDRGAVTLVSRPGSLTARAFSTGEVRELSAAPLPPEAIE
jgi:hypothetical protein